MTDRIPIRQFEQFWATFKPQRTDDLKSGAEEWIGRCLEWQALYILQDDGPGVSAPEEYWGQWACSPLLRLDRDETTREYPPFTWVPECDLERTR